MTAPLPADRAYRLWAATYDVENPVTALDQMAIERLTPQLAGTVLLDAGCGTGRRMSRARSSGAASVIGIDRVHAMLVHGKRQHPDMNLVRGDFRQLPFQNRHFDVVWCRLAIGHCPDLEAAYRELARVTRRPGALVITDFHPVAAERGLQRSFRDETGALHVVVHHVHAARDHERAALAAGLALETIVDYAVGPAVRRFYEAAGRLEVYEEQEGMPLVLALRLSVP
ncbi:MAG TPA: methyltransferase domain-containing protein [Gemmatimonadales bacterium]|nr:methyltransferase domain-containing protein [Gemmatimonadales bacterium]